MKAVEWINSLAALLHVETPPLPRLLPPARASGYTESFDGTRIYWELHGPEKPAADARPMVFCYGISCSMNHWRHQIARYSPRHPCLLMDYRGHHQSDAPPVSSPITLSALGKDVAAAIKAQNFAQAPHIWGHSMGVNVALELALAEPELCRSLILTGGTADNPFAHMFSTNLMKFFTDPLFATYAQVPQVYAHVWPLLLSRPEITRIITHLVGGFNKDASPQEDVDNYAQSIRRISPAVFFPLAADFAKGMSVHILPKIKTPALILAGSKDFVTPPAGQKRIASGLLDAEYAEMPAGSHCLHVDFPEYAGMKAEDFWRRRGL